MKRMFLVVAAIFCFASSALAKPWRVFDNAQLFSEEEISIIEQAIFDFQREANVDFAVLTTDDYIGNRNQQSIANTFYDSENFGFGQQASGVLYYIDMNQRIPCISTTGKMVDIFDEVAITKAHEACHMSLANGDYKGAVLKMINSASEAIKLAE